MSLDTLTSPVITGHRGFKAKYTENTISGFIQAFKCGATSLETDLWLTKDDVIMISHDANTSRVFCHPNGEPAEYMIPRSTYDELKDLQTIETGEKILTFQDVLRWFMGYVEEHGSHEHKLMLDIKKPNPAKVLRFLVKDLLHVKNDIGYWFHRLQLGFWTLDLLKYSNQDPFIVEIFNQELHNPLGYTQFDIFHISINWHDSIYYMNYNQYADELTKKDGLFRLKLTGVSLIYVQTWSTEFIYQFLPLLKAQGLKFYTWTINRPLQFDYLNNVGHAAKLKEYGIVTDHPDIMVDRKNGASDAASSKFSSEGQTKVDTAREGDTVIDYKSIKLTLTQRFFYKWFELFLIFGNPVKITDLEKDYSSLVDGNTPTILKPNRVARWLFMTLQHYGVF